MKKLFVTLLFAAAVSLFLGGIAMSAETAAKKESAKGAVKDPVKAATSSFNKMDADKDKKVTKDEYKTAMTSGDRPNKPTEEQIGKRFAQIDTDKSGDISLEELKAAPQPVKGKGKGKSDAKK